MVPGCCRPLSCGSESFDFEHIRRFHGCLVRLEINIDEVRVEVVSAAGHNLAVVCFPFDDIELLLVLFNVDGQEAIALFMRQAAGCLCDNGAVGDVSDAVGDGDIVIAVPFSGSSKASITGCCARLM